MFKYKVTVFILLIAVFTSAAVYCQQIRTITGTVTNVDMAGNVINLHTANGEMAFSISDQAKIIRNTHDIGLLDIKVGHPVTIQYDSSSPGKNNIINLVVNKPGND